MKKSIITVIVLLIVLATQMSCGPLNMKVDRTMPTWFEEHDSMASPGYEEGMAWWRKLDTAYRRVSIIEFGLTDAGWPLHLVVLANQPMTRSDLMYRDKPLLLINNAIHAGEPDGVDASMMVFRDILQKDSLRHLFKDVIIACIPYYNIGGALNRNSHTRANQEGPEEYGFRGNAQNLDLNRDFIKMDSRNSQSFSEIIRNCDPDLYLETHVSNGADYPYIMTYIGTLPSKCDTVLSRTMTHICTPYIENYYTRNTGQQIVPYVNVHGSPPDFGFAAFNDGPRYSSGYLATIGIPGFITETHMLKPFKDRVMATYDFTIGMVKLMHEKGKLLQERKASSRSEIRKSDSFGFNFTIDSTYVDSLVFHGYKYGYKPSDVTGANRPYYNRDSAYVKTIPYYTRYKPALVINKPKAYVLKRGFIAAEERLRAFGVKLDELKKDTVLEVEIYKIETTETVTSPYEKHYYHYNTKVKAQKGMVQLRKGDFVIWMNSDLDRLVMTILEPETDDSYFNWNFYDAVLQQKEWFSPYVFEDKAYAYLQADSALAQAFNQMSDSLGNMLPVAKARQQLYWIYKHSPHYEREHLMYPVFRFNGEL